LGAFENKRSFTSIGNLNWIITQLIEHNIPSGIYQVADDEPVSTNRLVRLIAESIGRKEKIWNIDPVFIRHIARLGDAFHLPINSERLKKLTESYVVSNKRLKNALGIDKMIISTKEGLRITIESFLERHRQ